jgi:hypothetical protein
MGARTDRDVPRSLLVESPVGLPLVFDYGVRGEEGDGPVQSLALLAAMKRAIVGGSVVAIGLPSRDNE